MHDLLKAAIEQHLADLSDDEFAALTVRVRPPIASDQRANQLGIDRTPLIEKDVISE